MAVLSALGRFVRLGCWVGLGAGAMLVDACHSGQGLGGRDSAADAPNSVKQDAAATSDAGGDAPLVLIRPIDVDQSLPADADQSQPADGGKTDLWDIICE